MALTCSIYINVHQLFMKDELQKAMKIFHHYFCMLQYFCMDLSFNPSMWNIENTRVPYSSYAVEH